MSVTVKVPTILRAHVDGRPSVVGDGATLGALLDDIERRHPGFKTGIVGEDGALRRFVNLYVNDEDARYLGALDAPVRDGDTVAILPAVAGGR